MHQCGDDVTAWAQIDGQVIRIGALADGCAASWAATDQPAIDIELITAIGRDVHLGRLHRRGQFDGLAEGNIAILLLGEGRRPPGKGQFT
jgi:hypothetical protein